MIVDGPTHEGFEEAPVFRWRSAPRWLLHVPLGLMLLVLMWSMSVPGVDLPTFGVAMLAIVCVGAVWGVRLIGWATAPVRRPRRRWLIAPAMAAVTVVLLVVGVPVRARFEFARSDFDAYVAGLEAQGDFEKWVPIDAPENLGGFDILWAYQVGENVIIYEATGLFFDDAGFAYLPEGPDSRLGNGSFEAPSFRSLGGGWYAWTASW